VGFLSVAGKVMGQELPFVPNDPLYSQQWNLDNLAKRVL
jgi:hypothetical protein